METIDLLTVLGTLGITAFGALIGAYIQSVREHTQWKRERKYEAYMLFFYEISRVFDWTNDIRSNGHTDSSTTREEAEGVWLMSAGINMHLPQKLESDFLAVNTFLGKLTTWGKSLLPDPEEYDQLFREYKPTLDRLQESMRDDLKINP